MLIVQLLATGQGEWESIGLCVVLVAVGRGGWVLLMFFW